MDRLAGLEEKLAEMQSKYDQLSSSKETIVNTTDQVAGSGKASTSAQTDPARAEDEDDKPKPRVKIVISKRNLDGEPIETQEKPQPEIGDPAEHAIVLRKLVFPKTAEEFEARSEIDIASPTLWSLLKENLGWYPYHVFRESPVTLESPFEAMIFDWEKLREVAQEVVEEPDGLQARKDLGLLLDAISGGASGDENLDRYFKTRDINKSQRMIQFTDLWTIFPPGTLIYGKPFQGQDQVFIVKDSARSWPQRNDNGAKEYLPWQLIVWSYDFQGESFGRTSFVITIESFDGYVPFTSLPYFPFEYHEKKDQIMKGLISRGKHFRKLCQAKGGSRLFEYAGDAISEKKGFSGMQLDDNTDNDDFYLRQRYLRRSMSSRQTIQLPGSTTRSTTISGRVMVDYASYFMYGSDEGRNGALRPYGGTPDCGCSDCQNNTELTRKYRTNFDKNAKIDNWEDEQYLICPPRVLGYILDVKEWAQLQVSFLHSVTEDDKTDAWNSRLQLADPKTKKLLFDLVRSHASPTSSHLEDSEDRMLEVDDIVPGKGKGLVILLYGPPGVGKTSTAETIAIAARRPLFSVSVTDVGTKAKNVEANLSRIFSLATSWEAILLIDEADVFLESRGRGGILQSTETNALVSVFLRVLDYYKGIMFLTTNQIAEFDIAIPSRIHVAIQYESLKDLQVVSIFTGFLKKLHEQNRIQDYDGIMAWINEDVCSEKLDGRQIRNVVTTALNLARAEAKFRKGGNKLTKQHLKDAFNNVKQFKRDFNTQMDRYIQSQKQMIR